MDPLNLTDPARVDNVLALLTENERFGIGESELAQGRTVFDGPVFTLPAGDVDVAIGAEYLWEDFGNFFSQAYAANSPYVMSRGHRRSNGLFAEINVPIIGAEMAIGTIFADFDGTYLQSAKRSTDAGAPYTENLSNIDTNARWRSTLALGATVGEHWLGQASWRHTEGTRIAAPLGTATPADTDDDQTFIEDFDVVDLYFQYNVLGAGFGEDLTFSLALNNAFDEEPPIYKGTQGINPGFTGFTLGRVLSVGVSKRF